MHILQISKENTETFNIDLIIFSFFPFFAKEFYNFSYADHFSHISITSFILMRLMRVHELENLCKYIDLPQKTSNFSIWWFVNRKNERKIIIPHKN